MKVEAHVGNPVFDIVLSFAQLPSLPKDRVGGLGLEIKPDRMKAPFDVKLFYPFFQKEILFYRNEGQLHTPGPSLYDKLHVAQAASSGFLAIGLDAFLLHRIVKNFIGAIDGRVMQWAMGKGNHLMRSLLEKADSRLCCSAADSEFGARPPSGKFFMDKGNGDFRS